MLNGILSNRASTNQRRMNPFIVHFTDGTTFFAGLLLVLVAVGLLLCIGHRVTRSILNVLAVIGIILVVISATPLPLWAYMAWIIPAIACLVLSNRAASSRAIRFAFCVVLLVSTVGLLIAEAQYHCFPSVTASEGTTIYVLGDSISAGIGTGHRTWPSMLEAKIPHRVVNLAQPGATVESAILQAQSITEPRSVVIVEIGGNDLLGGTDTFSFRTSLDVLISTLCADEHQILLFELPLFPFMNAYGHAQRTIASRHGVAILPKRYFAQVLMTENGTLDGLHLSQAGHEAMAEIIARVLGE